ncbi:MAG TPA: lipase maturation factor family protein [Pedococcus sp.]|nr:lipase maturation factor family protein [Pedococcus sp.]
MDWFAAEGYRVSRLLFQRGLGGLYLVAFLAAALQFRALLGSRGLLPVPEFVARVPFRRSPSLFHWRYSDRLFAGVAWTGVGLAALTVVGVTERLPLPLSMVVWLVLWALYLSIVNVGQRWYGFGWESLLLEMGFLAVFLGTADTAPPLPVLVALRWVLFRLEFGAGLIKLRGDPCWRDLTCLYYHHETQPMPGPLSWWFHHLPAPLHRVEVAANHVTQLVLPFGLFLPQPVAGWCAVVMVVTQLWLVLSGNFAWLNWSAIVLGLAVVPDSFWRHVLPLRPDPGATGTPVWWVVACLALAALVAVLSWRPARNLVSSEQAMNASFDVLHLVNTYGAFGSVTRTRYEVVVEGSAARAGSPWLEYEFKGKPGAVQRLPRQWAPYHLRLDWLLWFAALSPRYAEPWFPRLLQRLLEGDRATLRLLRHNPFPDQAPAAVRATLYRYRFTTWSERRGTGAWWHREVVSQFAPPQGLGARPLP